MTTLLEQLREDERDNPPWMYACYRIGHVVHDNGLCHCCLKVIPPDEDEADA